MIVTAVQLKHSGRRENHGRWHVVGAAANHTRCRRPFNTSDPETRVMQIDDDDDLIDWCRDCDARGASQARTTARLLRAARRSEPPADGYTRENILRDCGRALEQAFPERAAFILRELEKRLP